MNPIRYRLLMGGLMLAAVSGTAWAHGFTDAVWMIKAGHVNATEELWANKFIRVSDYHDANVTLSVDADSCIVVHGIMDGTTDMVFYNADMLAKAPNKRTAGGATLKGMAQYQFVITNDDGTTTTTPLRWAQKIERDGYDCYTVPYGGISATSDGTNSKTVSFTATKEAYTGVQQVNRVSIHTQYARLEFFICEKGTLNVTQTIEQVGCAFRSIMFNSDVTSYVLNHRARPGMNNEPEYQEYRERIGITDTKEAGKSLDYNYPAYHGRLGFNNFDNIGRGFTASMNWTNMGGISSGAKWWTNEVSVKADWALASRSITFPAQDVRARIVNDCRVQSQLNGSEVKPIGTATATPADIAFQNLGHPRAVSNGAATNPVNLYDGKYAARWVNSQRSYWGDEIGYWGQITTADLVIKIPQINVVCQMADYFGAGYQGNNTHSWVRDASGDQPYSTITDTEIRTPHRLNVTPYVPLVIDSYGYHSSEALTDPDGNVTRPAGTYFYVNGYFDMANAYNADIIDHCDLYILPGRYTETTAKTDDFADTDLGHAHGLRLTGVAAYRTDYRGTVSYDDGADRVTALNDATHFNLTWPEADMPQADADGHYSFYIKAYFKHAQAPIVDDNPAIHPVFMALTPKAATDVTTGIGDILAGTELGSDAVAVASYDLSGRPVADDAPGVHIVRYSDGTVRKCVSE